MDQEPVPRAGQPPESIPSDVESCAAAGDGLSSSQKVTAWDNRIGFSVGHGSEHEGACMKHVPDGGGVTDESRTSAGPGAGMSACF